MWRLRLPLQRELLLSKWARNYSESVKHPVFVELSDSGSSEAFLGELVSEHDGSEIVYTDEESMESASAKHIPHPLTVAAKSGMPELLVMPKNLSRAIRDIPFEYDIQALRQQASKIYNNLANEGSHVPSRGAIDADAQISSLFLHTYTRTYAALLEAKKRMPEGWRPKRILDVGFGPATGILVAHEVFGDDDIEKRVAVVLGDPQMRKRAEELVRLQHPGAFENVSIRAKMVPATSPLSFDLILSTDQLYQKATNGDQIADSHARHLAGLLAPGGVLVFTEKGDPIASEATARARQVLLRPENSDNSPKRDWVPINRKGSSKPNGLGLRVLAPCMHHSHCPLQIGFKNRLENPNAEGAPWCRFQTKALRPKFVVELKKGKYLAQPWRPANMERPGATYRRGTGGKALRGTGRPDANDNEMISYTYLAFVASEANEPSRFTDVDSPTDLFERTFVETPTSLEGVDNETKLARILRPPMKKKGHISMLMCSPSGEIETWTVTKSSGPQIYTDARKARVNELWPLGAKVVQRRGGLTSRHQTAVQRYEDTKRNKGGPLQKASDSWVKPESVDDGEELSFAESISSMELEELEEESGRAEKKDSIRLSNVHRRWK